MKLVIVPALFLLSGAGVAGAEGQSDRPHIFERLDEGSLATVRRCVGACDCVEAPFSGPIEGTARLIFVSHGPMFDEYRVANVNTVAHFDPPYEPDFTFGGEGIYRIGGEFGLRHEMKLNLAAGDEAVRRYESGLVPVGHAAFPRISITVRTDEDFCTQYILDLELIPTCPADFDGDGFVTGMDFDSYVRAFEAGAASADFDADGFVTGLDYDLFVAAFELLCE
jgi:hypothetical protein